MSATVYAIITTALIFSYIVYKIFKFINGKEQRKTEAQQRARITALETELMQVRDQYESSIKQSNRDARNPNKPVNGGTRVASIDEL